MRFHILPDSNNVIRDTQENLNFHLNGHLEAAAMLRILIEYQLEIARLEVWIKEAAELKEETNSEGRKPTYG